MNSPLKACPCTLVSYTKKAEYNEIMENGRHFLLSAWPISDEDNEVRAFSHVIKDITDRKQAEEELRLTSEIFMNMAEGVYLIGMDDGIIKYANSRFENMFGYKPGELLGKNVSIVNAPTDMTPEETKRSIMDILRKTGEWHGETKNIKKDGTFFWCYGNVSLFDSALYGRVIISVHTDITDRKRSEEEARKMHQSLVKAHRKLQKAYEGEKQLRDKLVQSEKLASLGQMGAKIAHEINNPLTVISGRAQLYLMEDLDERLKKTFELIIRETKRIENITSAYRNLSRPVLPKQELLDLNAVLEESVENLINTGEIKHYKIQRNFYPDLPQVIGDSNRLIQVFRNLIVNASHAMADCEEKTLTLRSSVSKDGKFAELSIQDTGTGIEKDKLDKIFEVYYTTKADGLGTGLGLVVVKDIVEKQHKGRVSVESELGKGTTFTVQLPFKTKRKRKKILIADDEAYIRELFMTFFEEKGLEVFTATNGIEALDNYERIQPDIVLSDIEMPVMNGFELAKEIKLIKPEQRIVLMTGFYYEHTVKEQLKKANIPFFTKPADLNDVWKIVSEEE
ncbi:MAG: PAS domain S-box protein [Candidatus Marinimicrobia bacterium]|nr:PAS domain S-box protein [Candidatus Neomarinimicrobiota bacterium]